MTNSVREKLVQEISSFKDLWGGGFYRGDPLDHMSSNYGIFGYIGVHHAIYLTCIKPYLHKESIILEIGPGRGAWTKIFRCAKEVYCLDALSAEHNNFWEYVGKSSNIKYYQVTDFSCQMLPDNKFDYLFSYDALCHVSFEGITEYAKNLYDKLKKNSHCFFMVADYEKYNSFIDNLDKFSVINAFYPKNRFSLLRKPFKRLGSFVDACYASREKLFRLSIDEDNEPTPGRWYDAGKERTCNMLKEQGYKIIDPDVGVDYRSPIIHFTK
jgi:hypothetical protein